MHMCRSIVWFSLAAWLSVVAGPMAFVISQVGRAAPADIYIVVDGGGSSLSQHMLAAYGASAVGPLRAQFAKMIHAPPSAREQLLHAGFIMMPAKALAAICGVVTDSTTHVRKS